MKRLCHKEPWLGKGIGRRLAEGCLYLECDADYAKIQIDGERRLESTIRIFGKPGFREFGQYYENPMENILYMDKEL